MGQLTIFAGAAGAWVDVPASPSGACLGALFLPSCDDSSGLNELAWKGSWK